MNASPMSHSAPTEIDDEAQRCAALLQQRAGALRPRVAVILGSGWQTLADRVTGAVAVPYGELPGFPQPGVGGHTGTLLLGRIGAREVAVLCGRKHAYETGHADGMKGAIRALAAFGITTLVQTNAAGSLDAAMPPGALMLITDHLNMVQASPLIGERGDARFVDMADAYCPTLRRAAQAAAAAAGSTLHEGVYAWVLGPQFETAAEIRMLALLGAQAVGMSTVPETILARHAGLKVLALSLMTNMACGMGTQALSHAHTLAMARESGDRAAHTLAAIVGAMEA
jgi:purine-nucleoside phosphorylase